MQFLVDKGIPKNKICYIHPPHDGTLKPRRLKIGIVGMKPMASEFDDFITKFVQATVLDGYEFEVAGCGWEQVLCQLKAAKAVVQYYPSTRDSKQDENAYRNNLCKWDYYLYFGYEEGLLGVFDSMAAGVPIIAHSNLSEFTSKNAITKYFSSGAELANILRKLTNERRQRSDHVKDWTWSEYARQHAIAWRMILENPHADAAQISYRGWDYHTPLPKRSGIMALTEDIRFWVWKNPVAFRSDFEKLWQLYTGKEFKKSIIFRVLKGTKNIISN